MSDYKQATTVQSDQLEYLQGFVFKKVEEM